MFEQLFQFPAVVARHRTGPFTEERERFLVRCAEQGMARSTLLSLAPYLLVIAQRLNAERRVTVRQINGGGFNAGSIRYRDRAQGDLQRTQRSIGS